MKNGQTKKVCPFLFLEHKIISGRGNKMENQIKNTVVVILAAGKGTRMKSDKAKVLHEINGKPMINFVVDAAKKVVSDNIVVVVGHQKEVVQNTVSQNANIQFAVQEEQLGTGHAVMCAMPLIHETIDSVVVLCGDVPLISSKTIEKFIANHNEENAITTVLAVESENPYGYGRMIVDENGNVVKIVEESDADENEKKIKIINSGIYCVQKDFLNESLQKITDNNSQGELYLTDIISVAHSENKKIGLYISANNAEVIGVNTCDDLSAAQQIMNN